MKLYAATLILVVIACSSFADETTVSDDEASQAEYNWNNPSSVTLEESEIAFTHGNIGPTKNESIFVWVYSQDGPIILYSLFHVDTWYFNKWGMYALVVDPDGNAHWHTNTPRLRDVQYSEDRLDVTVGAGSFRYADEISELTADFGEMSFSLSIESTLPPWKPGIGRIDYTPDGKLYQQRLLFVPWGWATGTVAIGEESFEIEGHAYASKTRFSNQLTRFAPLIYAIKVYSPNSEPGDDGYYLYLLDVVLHDAYDNRKVPMLVLARGSEWIFTTRDYELTTLETTSVEGIPHQFPTSMRIRGGSGGYTLEGVYTQERFINVTDVFSEIPSFIRKLVEVVIRSPVYIRSIVTFEGTLTTPEGEKIDLLLDGPFEYTVVR